LLGKVYAIEFKQQREGVFSEKMAKQKIHKANLTNHKNIFTQNTKILIRSRKKLLKIADYIIPEYRKNI